MGSEQDVSLNAGKWPVKDIIYVAIIGIVMIAAFLEWFLWLAAFCYCLAKVFCKADHWSVRFLAVTMIVCFVAFRGIFLPIMVVTLPLPAAITQYFPKDAVGGLQWFAFWTFAILLVVPWLLCLYRLTTSSLGRTKQISYVLDEDTAPKIVVVMPCYKEHPDVLLTAINSVVNSEYPRSCIHVFVSFDGDEIDELFLSTVDRLGIPVTMKDFPMSIDVAYDGVRITVSRFPHGGKRKCQKATFKLIDKIYAKYLQRNDDLFILFIDSDCILDRVCIQNFLYEMELKPGSKRNMLAMTGVITSTTEKQSLITLLQDMEYVHGQLFERSVESCCGAVTCLPGALTILRFSAFRNMARFYFSDKAEHCNDLFDYGKCHLGEDRWLTHLFMLGAKERYQIQMCTNAFCKTEAVQTFPSLLKQRRRWFLGFITNEVCMLTDSRIWRRYPLLCLMRFMQNTIRTTSLLFLIMVISLITTSNRIQNIPVGFIAVSLGLNYLLMLYFGAKIRRFKAWLYPIMFLVNPFFNWIYMVYGIFTAGQRTWGGPRVDAGAADVHISPQEAIEHAKLTGDELNIIPETFRPAVEAQRRSRPSQARLQPSESVVGIFVPAQELPGHWYVSSMGADTRMSNGSQQHRTRSSYDSGLTSPSLDFSLDTPRRVESILDDSDMRYQLDGAASSSSTGRTPLYDGHRRLSEPGTVETEDYPAWQARLTASRREIRSEQDVDQHRRMYTRFMPDPDELSTRLARLAPPDPIHDGSNTPRFGRSPLGRTSPMRDLDHEPQSPQIQSHRIEHRRRRSLEEDTASSSGPRRLQKRQLSPGDIV